MLSVSGAAEACGYRQTTFPQICNILLKDRRGRIGPGRIGGGRGGKVTGGRHAVKFWRLQELGGGGGGALEVTKVKKRRLRERRRTTGAEALEAIFPTKLTLTDIGMMKMMRNAKVFIGGEDQTLELLGIVASK
ncbi:hypothetical protein V6N12_060201 [Hibiscus sabdariffa]|uniref:Uncharacterized protein n=1 Tax=Hibiscus sabdariffa TaxID=183260 RepID=A0ABR2D4K5_9ROSI